MRPSPILQRSKTKVFIFGRAKPLAIKGKYPYTVETNSEFATASFYVLLSITAVQLGFVPVIRSVSENIYQI